MKFDCWRPIIADTRLLLTLVIQRPELIRKLRKYFCKLDLVCWHVQLQVVVIQSFSCKAFSINISSCFNVMLHDQKAEKNIFLQVGFVCWYVQSKWQWNLIFYAKLLQLTSRVGLILWCWSFIYYFQELSLQISYTLHMYCKNFGIVSLQLLQVHCKILGENFILVETLQTRMFRVIPQPL